MRRVLVGSRDAVGFQQEDLRLQGQRAGQTEALLLAAGKGAGRVAQPVMDFRPQAHVFQTAPGP